MKNGRWVVRQDGKNLQGEAIFVVQRKVDGGNYQYYYKNYTDCGRALRRANSLNEEPCAIVNNTTEESKLE